ncbi:MAG TPA: hypothetical protein PLN13_09390 [Bacteroidia bacterium]|nr:hypothetical protein [Bacteroidia bacterium]HRH08782.1 hypothetical protein [Bacteroidia bacterium]
MRTIEMFLKFGQKKDIEDLFYNGTIYMSPIQRFRKIEDNQLRGDLYEGISSIENYPSGQFEIPSIGFKGNYISLHLRKSYPTVLGNIYSLYCVSSHGWNNPLDFKIDIKVKNFGSHCLMVKDNQKFMDLIETKLKQLDIKFHHGFVEYYDRKAVTKEISIFEKPLEFEYQKEFRFYVERDSTEPFSFQIGSLAGIAEVYPANIVVDELKLIAGRQMEAVS